jgi:hypothetical protein
VLAARGLYNIKIQAYLIAAVINLERPIAALILVMLRALGFPPPDRSHRLLFA